MKAAFAEIVRRGEQLDAVTFDAALDPTSRIARESPHGVNPLLEYGLLDVSSHTRLLDLTASEEALLAQMSQDARQQIKRARAEGYSVRRVEWPAMLDDYYRVHAETYQRTGVLQHPREYFAGIARHRGKNGRAALWAGFAPDGRVVAFHNDARSHGASHYHTGCCETDALKSGINYLLFWEAIAGAKADGCVWYEIGEVFPNVAEGKERGLTVFKSKFGGEIHRLFRGSLSLKESPLGEFAPTVTTGSVLRDWLRATHRLTGAIAGERAADLSKAAAISGYRAARHVAGMTRSMARENRLLVTGRIPFMRPLWDSAEDAVADGSSGSVGRGDAHAELDAAFRSAARVSSDSEVILTSSGRTALGLALSILAARNPNRRRVLLPSYSCRGLFDPIVRLGLIPEFVEVDEDLVPDASDTIDRMGPDVLAWLAVHLCGYRMETATINEAARAHDVAVIEDCCHYLDATVTSDADFQIFSFGIGKPIMATAGGALVTGTDREQARSVSRQWPKDDSQAATRRYNHFRSTFFRARGLPPTPLPPSLVTQFGDRLISDADARLASVQLRKLPTILEKRRHHATALRAAMSTRGNGFHFQSDRDHVYTKLPVTFASKPDATRFVDFMTQRGIEIEPMYVPLHQRDFASSYATRCLPRTAELAGCVFNLPIRPNLTTRELSRISRAIAAFAATIE
jgi:dTDP-4-amino-4,6-dideoxygalactose transaminase